MMMMTMMKSLITVLLISPATLPAPQSLGQAHPVNSHQTPLAVNRPRDILRYFHPPSPGSAVVEPKRGGIIIIVVVTSLAQSNLGRGPRRGAVAHVRRKVPIGNNGAPQIRLQKYLFPWTDPQTPTPASSLDPPDLRCQTASGSDAPFSHNSLQLDTRTDRQNVQRATRPNNNTRFVERRCGVASEALGRTGRAN